MNSAGGSFFMFVKETTDLFINQRGTRGEALLSPLPEIRQSRISNLISVSINKNTNYGGERAKPPQKNTPSLGRGQGVGTNPPLYYLITLTLITFSTAASLLSVSASTLLPVASIIV